MYIEDEAINILKIKLKKRFFKIFYRSFVIIIFLKDLISFSNTSGGPPKFRFLKSLQNKTQQFRKKIFRMNDLSSRLDQFNVPMATKKCTSLKFLKLPTYSFGIVDMHT